MKFNYHALFDFVSDVLAPEGLPDEGGTLIAAQYEGRSVLLRADLGTHIRNEEC